MTSAKARSFNMTYDQELPEAINNLKRSLRPYIKQRQEVAQIRRLLASYLSSHVRQIGDLSLSRPLSLVDTTRNVDRTSHGLRGLQKEYLRCVRTKVKAQEEYDKISQEHRSRGDKDGAGKLNPALAEGFGSSMESFIDLVRQRQKHERLRIIQDYLDVLAQKPAAMVEHLDLHVVLKDVESLPKMPSEILHGLGSIQKSTRVDLKELVDQLEKSVLRAKMLLKREQNLLSRVRADNTATPVSNGSRLEAVGMTRSVLINWIEAELLKAGESSPESEIQQPDSPVRRGKQLIDSELISIHRNYARYTKARQALITAAAGVPDLPATTAGESEPELAAGNEQPYSSTGMEVTHPYLESIAIVSNEQKAMIQQKSHLTISLSKQLKEATQGLDRLADESHLLPAYPIPAIQLQRHGLEVPISFGDEISNHEKPNSSLRAKSWVHAAEQAGNATKHAVSEKLDEGNVAFSDAQKALLELQRLFIADINENGSGNTGRADHTGMGRDMWAALDGNLGVIKGAGLE